MIYKQLCRYGCNSPLVQVYMFLKGLHTLTRVHTPGHMIDGYYHVISTAYIVHPGYANGSIQIW